MNRTYHKLFDPTDGILFRKSNSEIDELLFVHKLHADAQTAYKKKQNEYLQELHSSKLTETFTENDRNKRIAQTKRDLVIANKSLFFNVSTYFRLRERFDSRVKNIESLAFDCAAYYKDKEFRARLITSFSKLVFMRAIKLIRKESAGDDIYNWLRTKGNQDIFFEVLENDFNDSVDLDTEYRGFVEEFKI